MPALLRGPIPLHGGNSCVGPLCRIPAPVAPGCPQGVQSVHLVSGAERVSPLRPPILFSPGLRIAAFLLELVRLRDLLFEFKMGIFAGAPLDWRSIAGDRRRMRRRTFSFADRAPKQDRPGV